MVSWILGGLLFVVAVIALMALKMAQVAAEEAMRASKTADEIYRTLRRTMQVNAYFHAKTWALQKGEPEPPRPELE